ncbi:MAG: CDP-diacylglycerol--serine O-phosphatidyltransferase [Coprobacter sp.]|nr:CDP-diacylglycerol--serine O-phosphatidyltransferase [Coprobacter sp.]
MKRITSYIPNTITCGNLLSGCMAVIFTFQDRFDVAALFILLAAICDFLDGLAARVLKAYSPMGKELDSLADLVSFGIAPGMMVWSLLDGFTLFPYWFKELSYIALLIPVAGALRLAKFNTDTRQTTSFRGLPIPANALFWIGICLFDNTATWHPLLIPALVVVFSYLMVSELPMFSLKVSSLSWRANKLRYILIAGSLALIAWYGTAGFAGAIVLYILLSIIDDITNLCSKSSNTRV